MALNIKADKTILKVIQDKFYKKLKKSKVKVIKNNKIKQQRFSKSKAVKITNFFFINIMGPKAVIHL